MKRLDLEITKNYPHNQSELCVTPSPFFVDFIPNMGSIRYFYLEQLNFIICLYVMAFNPIKVGIH